MPWKRMLAYITGSVNEALLLRIEYLLEENRVLRNQIEKRLLLTDRDHLPFAAVFSSAVDSLMCYTESSGKHMEIMYDPNSPTFGLPPVSGFPLPPPIQVQ